LVLTAELLRRRAAGTITDEEDDAIADRLEAMWWQMSDDEHGFADEWLRLFRATAEGSPRPVAIPKLRATSTITVVADRQRFAVSATTTSDTRAMVLSA
jgi:hypothetical protein